jgi:oxygen-dependent protoporphyrinogen oxidase
MRDVVIVGGGITGLVAAYRLRQVAPEVDITLIEATGHLGGKIGTERPDGFVLEWGPDCFLSRKPGGIGLCEELGIADELVGRDEAYNRTYVLRHGRLHPLPEGLTGMIPSNLEALSHSTLLSEAAKERIGQEPELPPEPENGDESVAAFISRRLGQEALANLVEPLMAGIYAGQVDQLSLAATFPQLRQLELRYGSLLNGLSYQPPATNPYPPFVSFPNGMQTLVERLVQRLEGVNIWRETAVTGIKKTVSGGCCIRYRLSLIGEQLAVNSIHCSVVVVTTPAYVSSQLVQTLDPELAGVLREIPYASTALVNLAYEEVDMPELAGYGYLIPQAEGREALACTWSSRKWQNRAPAGKVLLRLYIGRYGDGDVTAYDDDHLLTIAQTELQQTLAITAKPLFHRIVRYPQAMPQYTLGHLERLARIEERLTQHPGLFLAGAAFQGVGLPDCIVSAETAVSRAVQFLEEKVGKL